MKIRILFILGLYLSFIILPTGDIGICATGVPGAKFLSLPMSSRAVSLGNAFTAVMDDINCQYVNVAGIANLRFKEVSIHNTFWMYDMNYSAVSFAARLPKGVLGSSLILFLPGKIISYDGWGYEKEKLNMLDMSLKASYALKIKHYLFAGVGLKYIYRNLAEFKQKAVDFDAGIIFKTTFLKMKMFKINNKLNDNFQAGVAIQNIKGKIGKDKLPTQLRFGILYKIIPPLFFTSDYVLKFHDTDQINLGVEYSYQDQYFIRAGYILGDKNYVFTAGMGIKIQIKNSFYRIDYSYSPLPFDYNVHSLNLTISFSAFDIEKKEEINRLYLKGGTYYLKGRYDDAINEWNKILEIDPSYPGIKEKIQEVKEIKEIMKIMDENNEIKNE